MDRQVTESIQPKEKVMRCAYCAALEAAGVVHMCDPRVLREKIDQLEAEHLIASNFMRTCIEAVGYSQQPPENFQLSTESLGLQVIGEIEKWKGVICDMEDHIQRIACWCNPKDVFAEVRRWRDEIYSADPRHARPGPEVSRG